jgi:integrase
MDRGSVRWHRNGWEVRVQRAGRRITRRVHAPNTRAGRRAAEDALDALVAQLGLDADGITVAQLLEQYELARSASWSPSTRATHRFHTAPLIDAFGPIEVSALTAATIEATHGAWQRDGTKPGTVRRRFDILRSALRQAERWQMIGRSPAPDVDLPTVDATPIELGDLGAVLAAISRIDHDRLRVAAWLAVATASRRGELVALRWLDVQPDTLRFPTAISVDRDGTLVRKATKGHTAKTVAVDETTAAVLTAWRKQTIEAGLSLGHRTTSADPVLASPHDPGQPWHPDRVTKTWERHREAIGLSAMRFHDLRHLHATALLSDGIAPHTVAARLGHRSTRMTLDVYGHAVPAQDRAAADVIGRAARSS